MAKKLIPCRVCGKMFEPCAYCQKHSDTFRWRNFACSIECAKEYLAETMAYRESLKAKSESVVNASKKSRKKSSTTAEVTAENASSATESAIVGVDNIDGQIDSNEIDTITEDKSN